MKRALFTCALLMLSLTSVAFAQTKPAAGPDQALMDIEHAWAAASLKNDVAALDAILADNFWATSVEGKIVARTQVLADAKANKLTRSAVSDMKVVLINPTTAIVTGMWSGAGTDAKGVKFDTRERWTDVFVNQGGKWKCVTTQATTIAK